ncbi:MAG: TRAM domain-containing protein [Nakamurella sp.]
MPPERRPGPVTEQLSGSPITSTDAPLKDPSDLAPGDLIDLTVGPVAHGGHCVARYQGRVVFVRHTLPGEQVRALVTEARPGSFCRADAVEIVTAAEGRVTPPCVHFHPGGCGGCDFQHASPELQRQLKTTVLQEQLQWLAKVELPAGQGEVRPLPGDGFGWRTRVRWGLALQDGAARLGPRVQRSAAIVPVGPGAPCRIASPGLSTLAVDVAAQLGPDLEPEDTYELVLTMGEDGVEHVTEVGAEDADVVRETVKGRSFAVAADGFWQAHPAAATTYVDAVMDLLPDDLTGLTAWDLYGGVGLFAAFLADAVGVTGTVHTVEVDRAATALARHNLADLAQVRATSGMVEKVIPRLPGLVDAVVLDPPRTGAGKKVCDAVAMRRPSVIVYVACDPAALARDTSFLAGAGYRLDAVRAFDAYPQTHHLEAIARFVPAGD